ncbi:MAG: 50S ribosomal protein L4 [Chlamydiia bacterium]|nr:50S ribosomal protein L4 [Chlamydiia bacterium]
MATLKKYNLAGEETGSLQVDDVLLEVKAHPQSVKDYLVAIRNNARQWSASTKTRAEINRTGRKPHPQKGGGRSRQGDLAAPQYKGGGIVFGPRPKFDIHVRINKKERRAAIATLIAEKLRADRVHVLQKEHMKEPRTKKLAAFFDKMQLGSSRILVLGEAHPVKKEGKKKKEARPPHHNLIKSLRNIPKKEYMLLPQMNGYALARCQDLVILESALDQFLSVLGGSSNE